MTEDRRLIKPAFFPKIVDIDNYQAKLGQGKITRCLFSSSAKIFGFLANRDFYAFLNISRFPDMLKNFDRITAVKIVSSN